jgi:hypothetical protein
MCLIRRARPAPRAQELASHNAYNESSPGMHAPAGSAPCCRSAGTANLTAHLGRQHLIRFHPSDWLSGAQRVSRRTSPPSQGLATRYPHTDAGMCEPSSQSVSQIRPQAVGCRDEERSARVNLWRTACVTPCHASRSSYRNAHHGIRLSNIYTLLHCRNTNVSRFETRRRNQSAAQFASAYALAGVAASYFTGPYPSCPE